MQEEGLRFLEEKPDRVKVWLIVLTAIIAVLFIISCANIKFCFLDKIHDTLLSGVIGAALSCAFVLFGFGLSNTSKTIDNQLELRKLFSEELRWEVHRTLSTGDKSYWYKKADEEMPESLKKVHGDMTKQEKEKTDKEKSEKLREEIWQKSKAFNDFFLPALDDYMGVFEIAYMMIKKGQMSKNNFAVSYLYRLENLAKYEVVEKKLEKEEKKYWKTFRELREMYLPLKADE